MKNLEKIINKDPYSFKKVKKENILKKYLLTLNNHHYDNCEEYKKLTVYIFCLNNIGQ